MPLSKEQILAADDRKTENVAVPEWGGDVLVRRLTSKERDAFEDGMYQLKGKKREVNLRNFRARLAAACLVDEAGGQQFTPEEAEKLGDKCAAALTRIVKRAMEMNGFDDSDVEDLTKNS